MARRPRREIVLGAVAVLLMALALLSRASWTSGTAGTAARQTATRPSAAQPVQNAQKSAAAIEDVRLGSLEEPRPEPVESTRDPFRFKPKPPPSPPPKAPASSQPAAAVPSGPPVPPPPPRIALKFIGIVEPQNTKPIAVLSDARGVYQGRVGDIIDGRYRILNIGVESIDLVYLDGRGRQTIRLTGQ